MKLKQKKWWRKTASVALIVSMTATPGTPVMAAPRAGVDTGTEISRNVITEIDFNDVEGLDSLTGGWKVGGVAGSASLVESDHMDGGKALKLSRTSDGASTQLYHENLGIEESSYPYVSVEAEIKISSEQPRANQWSLPYLKDNGGTVGYTLFVDGDWSKYQTHVGSKNNKQAAGSTALDAWQTVRMDLNLEKDTFRVSVDGAYLLYEEAARAKVNSLKTIQFYADSWNRGTIYIRSVKVTGQKKHTESKVYYVSNEGDDMAAGTSEDTAWKTLSRVNQEHFIPGDEIRFRCGDAWEDETLFPHGSGNDAAKIVIGSYGGGEMPKISANGRAADAICLYNQEYWEISGLDVSNTVEGFGQLTGGGSGDGTAPDFNNGARNQADGSKLGDFRGIHIAGRDVASLKGYHLHDLKVHDVTGVVAWIGNTGLQDAGIVNNAGLDGSKRTGGVLIECLKPSGSQPTQFSDILIEDSEFINNSFCGITVKQWNGSGNQYGENPGWANRNGGKGKAPDYQDTNWYPHSNIIIQDNYINQGASAYACNGIYLTSSRDSLIQRNVLEHIGTCGIELYFTDNVAVQYNEVSDVIKKGGGADDNAIDPDWRVTNALIQYNYIHDTGEGLLLCGVEFNSGVIRYNLIQDCGRSYVHYSMGSGYFQIYNNVFYRSKEGNSTNNFDPWGGGKASYINNIFYDGQGTGFNFSAGSSFAYNNNAYYGTAPTGKDANPVILTEDPFEGAAPSLDRMGSFETGVLLEANGLRPRLDSPLIGAGVVTDPTGLNIDNGLKTRGREFNFTPLDAADTNWFGDCVNIGRTDYPLFEKTGTEATFDTAKTQNPADGTAPTIGIFEVPVDKDAVILRGTVSDGLNPVAGAQVEVKVGEKTVTAVTNEAGTYMILQGLEAGEATISVTYGEKEHTTVVTLEKGKVNLGDVAVTPQDMPEAFDHILIDETFEAQTSPENFGFEKGAEISGGKLVITKTGTMGNAASAVKTFAPEVAAQTAVDLAFDYQCTVGDKQGFEFRDSYGRLLFAVCAAADKSDLRPSITGGAVEDSKAASTAEPVWNHIPMNKNTVYKIRLHADFEEKTVSYSIAEQDGKVVAQELDMPTEASNLAKMIACSWWASKSQSIDNFRLTAPVSEPDLPLKGMTVYAFGDSIVAGHKYKKQSFADFTADQEGIILQKFAVNGATVLDASYEGGQILTQFDNAPNEQPDYVLFDGGTNDAEYIAKNAGVEYGTVSSLKEPESFDTATFAGAFENMVYEMKQKYPEAQFVYVAVHKLGSRDQEVQEKLRELELQICAKWEIAVADVYGDTKLDTSDDAQRKSYTFNDLAGNGLPGTDGSGTHPNFAAIEEFYVPVVSERLRNPEVQAVDKDKLTELAASAEKETQKTGVYTTESIEKLKKAVEEAKKVLDKPGVTQAEVEAQLTALQKAMDELEAVNIEYYAEHIEVTKLPHKTRYEVDEDFDLTGMEVTLYEKASPSNASPSNAGRTRVLEEDEYEVEHDGFDTAGTKDVTVSYRAENAEGLAEDFTASFQVEVTEAWEDYYTTGIQIQKKPHKTEYEVGDEFDPAGMKVVAYEKTYETASSSNAQMRERVLSEDDYDVDYDFDTSGRKQVTVLYWAVDQDGENVEFSDSIYVEVSEPWVEYYTTGIKVKKKPNKMKYWVGETFDPEGMKVVAYERAYSTASSSNAERRERVLSEDDYELLFPQFDSPGTKTIRVAYEAEDKDGDDKIFRASFLVEVSRRGGASSSDDDGDDTYTPDDNVSGTWQAGQDGIWRFQKSGGSYAADEWAKINGRWYHFGADSIMQTGWLFDKEKWYLLHTDGTMLADVWALIDGKWYYLNPDGTMKCNEWFLYKGKWYYLGSDGSMLTGGKTPDGYQVDSDGRLIG